MDDLIREREAARAMTELCEIVITAPTRTGCAASRANSSTSVCAQASTTSPRSTPSTDGRAGPRADRRPRLAPYTARTCRGHRPACQRPPPVPSSEHQCPPDLRRQSRISGLDRGGDRAELSCSAAPGWLAPGIVTVHHTPEGSTQPAPTVHETFCIRPVPAPRAGAEPGVSCRESESLPAGPSSPHSDATALIQHVDSEVFALRRDPQFYPLSREWADIGNGAAIDVKNFQCISRPKRLKT
jgi:hypothetical protein